MRAFFHAQYQVSKPSPYPLPWEGRGGSVSANDMSSIATVATEPVFLPFASLAWFKRELAPTPERARRTAIMVGGRSFVRDHFHDAAGAGAVCHRLHAFLHVKGNQVSHDTYRMSSGLSA